MNRFKATASLVLGGLLLIVADAALAATITCESRNNSRQTCSADTSGGVRVSQQLSSQGCWQGDTWGYDRNRIWVDRGCRAVFQVGGQRSSSSSNSDAIAAAAVVGIAAAALIASKNHDDHRNSNNNRYDNSYYDNRYRDYDRPEVYDNSRYGYNGYGGDPPRDVQLRVKGQPHFLLPDSPARSCRGLPPTQLQPVHSRPVLGREGQSSVGRTGLQGGVRGVLTCHGRPLVVGSVRVSGHGRRFGRGNAGR